MFIFEVFDSKIKDLQWQSQGRFDLTAFKFNDIQYVIQLERKSGISYDPNLKGKKVAEASFFLADENDVEKAFSSADSAGHAASKVYGIVFHAILEKYPSEFDAIYFLAERRHSDSNKQYRAKVKIYSFLAEYLAKRGQGYFYKGSGNTVDRSEFLVSKYQLMQDNFVCEWLVARNQFLLV